MSFLHGYFDSDFSSSRKSYRSLFSGKNSYSIIVSRIEAFGGSKVENSKNSAIWDYTIPKGSMLGKFPHKQRFSRDIVPSVPTNGSYKKSEVVYKSPFFKESVNVGRCFVGSRSQHDSGRFRMGRKETQKWFIKSELKRVNKAGDFNSLEVDPLFFDTPMVFVPGFSYFLGDLAGTEYERLSLQEFIPGALSSGFLVLVSVVGKKVTGIFGCTEDDQGWAVDENGSTYRGVNSLFLARLVKGISRDFVDDINSVLDLLLNNYDYVSWSADTGNSQAVSVYNKCVEERNGFTVVRGSQIFFLLSKVPILQEVFKKAVLEKNIQASFRMVNTGDKGFI